jgi:hypothetical protein
VFESRYLVVFLVFPDFPHQLGAFALRVKSRLQGAFRPSTHGSQHTATIALALFCLYYDVSFPSVHIFTMLSFLEFLIASNLSVPKVRDYVPSIKSLFKLHIVSIQVFESPQLSLALSSKKIGFPLCLSNLCLLLNSSFNSSITFLISLSVFSIKMPFR